MNMFQRKFLKLQYKNTANKKEEIIRLHSDLLRFFQSSFSQFFTLRLLKNTYEGHPFQKRCSQDHTTHRNMKSLIYIFENFNTKHTYAKTDNASFLCQDEIQTSSNRAKT